MVEREVRGTDIWNTFSKSIASIKDDIEVAFPLGSTVFGEKEDNSVLEFKSRLTLLQKYVTDNIAIMPPYDVRRTQEILEGVQRSLKQIETERKPKKKFSFSSRNKPKEITGAPSGETKVVKDCVAPKQSESVVIPGSYVVKDQVGGEIFLDLKSFESLGDIRVQLLIQNCRNTTISANTLVGSVRIENSSDCFVILGPCCTSTYIENSAGCTVFTLCHQLRIHQCKDFKLYVLVNSHPIVEDCSNMGFGPYHATYPRFKTDLEVANLLSAKCWDNVVDFRWHRSTKSPNWHILSPEERISHLDEALVGLGWHLNQSSTETVPSYDSKKAVVESVFTSIADSGVTSAADEEEF